MHEQIERILLGLTATLSVLVSLLDWLGLLEGVPFLANKIPSLTLLALGLVTGYLVLERRSKLDKIEHLVVNGTDRIIRSLGGVDVQKFENRQELYEYAAKRTREAKSSIDDMTWSSYERRGTLSEQQAFNRYIASISAACTKKNIKYREIISVPPVEHLDRAEDMISKNLPGYEMRYYELSMANETPPILEFMVVDSQEVIIAFYRAPILPAQREIRLSVRHPDIVRLFQDYYDTIWQAATQLTGDDGNVLDRLQELRKKSSR